MFAKFTEEHSISDVMVSFLRVLKPGFTIYCPSLIMQQVTWFGFACTLKQCKVGYWSSEVSVDYIQRLLLILVSQIMYFPIIIALLVNVVICIYYCCMMHSKLEYVQWQMPWEIVLSLVLRMTLVMYLFRHAAFQTQFWTIGSLRAYSSEQTVQPVNEDQAASPSHVGCIDSRSGWNASFMQRSHRFAPMCFPVPVLAVFPKPHCVDCFFLGTGVFALPLKAFVGSNLLRWLSPAGSAKLTSLLKANGWYSDAHCCRGKRS